MSSTCAHFGISNGKDRAMIAEDCCLLLDELSKRSRLVILNPAREVLWTIAKKSLLVGMRVEIKIILKGWMIVLKLLGQVMQGSNFREDVFVELVVLPIQILSAVTGPKVASNYTVGVEHWHNVEDEVLPQPFARGMIRDEMANEALNHERRVRLSRMNSTRY